jgi:transcriptional regulator with XRE-family HTH domain
LATTDNDKDALSKLVARLAAARRVAGLTQKELATLLRKSSQSAVAKLENEERKLDLPDFVRWARAVGEDPHELLRQFERDLKVRNRMIE